MRCNNTSIMKTLKVFILKFDASNKAAVSFNLIAGNTIQSNKLNFFSFICLD